MPERSAACRDLTRAAAAEAKGSAINLAPERPAPRGHHGHGGRPQQDAHLLDPTPASLSLSLGNDGADGRDGGEASAFRVRAAPSPLALQKPCSVSFAPRLPITALAYR